MLLTSGRQVNKKLNEKFNEKFNESKIGLEIRERSRRNTTNADDDDETEQQVTLIDSNVGTQAATEDTGELRTPTLTDAAMSAPVVQAGAAAAAAAAA
ncbi:MAG: hypothetical protein ACI83Y_001641, partial [Candidatus Azotimanducaceae bacterium]